MNYDSLPYNLITLLSGVQEFRSSGVQPIPLGVIAYLITSQPYNLITLLSEVQEFRSSGVQTIPLDVIAYLITSQPYNLKTSQPQKSPSFQFGLP